MHAGVEQQAAAAVGVVCVCRNGRLRTSGLLRQRPKREGARMGVPHITSFCWCLGLEMGAKVIAYVHLLISLGLVALCALYAEKFREMAGSEADADDHVYSTWYKIAVSVASFSTCHVVLAATLVYGTYKRSTVALRVWVWVMAALFVTALVLNVVSMALFGMATSGSEIFLAFVVGLLFYAVLAYCILCVNSFYLMVKSSEDMEGPARTDY